MGTGEGGGHVFERDPQTDFYSLLFEIRSSKSNKKENSKPHQ